MDLPCQLIVHPASSKKDQILINLFEDLTLRAISKILMQHYLVESKSLSFNIDYTSTEKFKGQSQLSTSYADYSEQEDDEFFETVRKEYLENGTWVDFSDAHVSSINLEYNDIFDCTGYVGSDFVEYHLFFLPENTVSLDSMDESQIYPRYDV